jgi:hypothetical protein
VQLSKNQSLFDWITVKREPPKPGTKLGIALSTLSKSPINGLRHTTKEDTNGWYIWCGSELSEEANFFSPLHVEHLAEYLPQICKYLDLPPGYRFLIDDKNYEDVWFDSALLIEPLT